MRWLTVLLGCLAVSGAQAEDCITVSDSHIEELETRYEMTTLEWQARINNDCDSAYDGTLTVRFLDEDGEVLHETLEIVILQNRGSENTNRRVTIPAGTYKRVAEIEVDIRERKRPS